jgi:hypothetical protein
MKKHFTKPWFVGGMVLYFFIRLSRDLNVELPEYISGYVNDLLCLPLVLWSILGILRWIHRPKLIVLSPAKLIVAWIAFSLLFEWILPLRSPVYTADLLDVILYGVGALIFWWIQKIDPSRKQIRAGIHT